MLEDSSKERLVDKRKIREMRHAAGVRYFDFTPVMIVALASIVGARYLAIGTGDTELYIFAGMVAAVVILVAFQVPRASAVSLMPMQISLVAAQKPLAIQRLV